MQKKIKSFSIKLFAIFVLSSCGSELKNSTSDRIKLKEGQWTTTLNMNGKQLPFLLKVEYKDNSLIATIINGEEKIEISDIRESSDSIIFNMPVFESAFYLKKEDSISFSGIWVNYYKSREYKIPVKASYGYEDRFYSKKTSNTESKIKPKYEVTFSPNTEDEYKSIGLFSSEKNEINGTFATETGDYRYLSGNVIGDSIFLSTFDGSHAFLFEAKVFEDSLNGMFYSGTHFKEAWVAKTNESFKLRNADSLTFSTASNINIELPNHKDSLINTNSAYFKSKVKMIQIMGSWCPNCLDESVYYKGLYEEYKDKGLEIIAVAFERTRNKERALKNLNKLKEKTKANYTFLLGGSTREDSPLDVFPYLNHIMSYPTTIFLNKENEVTKIHTGFYGPSTGNLFENYKKETESFLDSLLAN